MVMGNAADPLLVYRLYDRDPERDVYRNGQCVFGNDRMNARLPYGIVQFSTNAAGYFEDAVGQAFTAWTFPE